MPASEQQVAALYQKILKPLEVIYNTYMNSGRGPTGAGSGTSYSEISLTNERVFLDIPLIFGAIMGHQPGIFLGDMDSEKVLYKSFSTERTIVIIDVSEINRFSPEINDSGVALLLAHELGHAYRWSLGHIGGNNGYTNEMWARTLELAYVEALNTNDYAEDIGVNFNDTVAFIKKYRKSLYKLNDSEKKYYTELTGDNTWASETTTTGTQCPKGDPDCGRPAGIPRLHISCNAT